MRLVVWNIQNFTLKRLNDNSGATVTQRAAISEGNLANLLYILSTVEQADADVFIVLEPLCTTGNVGTLAAGEGPQGLLYLLSQLREFQTDQWCLVPPLRVNPFDPLAQTTRTETVGVFWRNDRVQFVGPQAIAVPAYPAPWDSAVPPGTTAAAQCRFFYPNGTEILFPGTYNRRPYLTTFTERGGMGRTIRIFSIHTKPGVPAQQATATLTSIQAADRVPGANQATLFAGDFNINFLEPNILEEDTIKSLTRSGAAWLSMYRPNGNLPRSVLVRRDEARARLFLGTSYLKPMLLDYGFIQYGAGASPPEGQFGAVVLDRVAGISGLPGVPTFTSDMGQSLASIQGIEDINVNIAAPPYGAVRVNGVTTITTTAPHGLEPGYSIGLIDIQDYSFWQGGPFTVQTVPSPTSFTVSQVGRPNGNSGNGQVIFGYRNYVFRMRWNYWHISPPVADTGTGTSDHLPVFMII